LAGEWKRSYARFFKKEPRGFADYARRTAIILTCKREALIQTQRQAQAIEAGAEI
jgi:hypothetical protein